MQLIARLIGCALPPRYRCGGPRFGQTTGVLLASPRGFVGNISAFASRIEIPLEAWQRVV